MSVMASYTSDNMDQDQPVIMTGDMTKTNLLRQYQDQQPVMYDR
jgi:hypothetical protein